MRRNLLAKVEWPTVALAIACQGVWLWFAFAGEWVHPAIWLAAMTLVTALYWSLVHEAVHLHPTRIPWVNQALVWLPIGWVYSYGRFRDGHLQHHATGALTDPFDDPESWYLDRRQWQRTGRLTRAILDFNNTLFGRLTIGPAIVLWRMVVSDGAAIAAGGETGRRIARDWLAHLPGVVLLAAAVYLWSPVPAWQFVLAA